jgi:hypothetical protein
MNVKDATQLILKAREVFAWVRVLDEDGVYIRVTKTAALNALARCEQEFTPETNGDDYLIREEEGIVYIN